jgi:hypothetical protein
LSSPAVALAADVHAIRGGRKGAARISRNGARQ